MADCLLNNSKDHLANGKMALHVLEIIESMHKSIGLHKEIKLQSTCEKPKIEMS